MFLSYVNSKANYKPPEPIIVDGEAEYEVKKILRYKRNGKFGQYLDFWDIMRVKTVG